MRKWEKEKKEKQNPKQKKSKEKEIQTKINYDATPDFLQVLVLLLSSTKSPEFWTIIIIASFSPPRLSFFLFFSFFFLSFSSRMTSNRGSSISLPVRSSQGILYLLVILSVIFGSFLCDSDFFFLNFVIFSLFPFSFSFLSFFADGTAKGIFIIIVTTDVSITRSSSHGVSLFFSGIFFFSEAGNRK